MAIKPETAFIKSVNKHLPETYNEHTNNPFRSGIADSWYTGNIADMWIEYKFIESLPRTRHFMPDLSARQVKWLKDRHNEGRNVAVIQGIRTGGIIYTDLDWENPYPRDQLAERIRTRPELAQWIYNRVGWSECRLTELRKQQLMPQQ